MPSTTTPPLPNLLTITPPTEHLCVNTRHVRRLVHERHTPYVNWGHLIRFDLAEVESQGVVYGLVS